MLAWKLNPHHHPILRHPSVMYKALINAGASIRRERIRPTQWDSHGGRSDECSSRACIACRHNAIDSNPYEPPICQEARGIDASFKGVRVHSTQKGEGTGGKPVTREETTLLSIRAPYLRPLNSGLMCVEKSLSISANTP